MAAFLQDQPQHREARITGYGMTEPFWFIAPIMMEDSKGRTSTDQFCGTTGKRVKTLDHLGRVRPK
jgi:hypothetical protein